MQRKEGDWRWVLEPREGAGRPAGRLRRLIGVETDVTERKLYEEALFREKESAQITLQSIGDGVVTTNADSVIEYMNPVAEDLTGWRLEEAMGKSRRHLPGLPRGNLRAARKPADHRHPPRAAIKSVRPTLLIRRDGNEIYVDSTAAPIRDDAATYRPAAARVPRRQRVARAQSPPELPREPRPSDRPGQPAGVRNAPRASAQERQGPRVVLRAVLPRLDQFKIVNDSCGHNAGDALLGQVGALLKSKVRWRDTLSRLGRR